MTMEAYKTVLAIDIGTSSLKAGLIDEKGTLLAFERERFSKENPSTMWLDAFSLCAKKIFQEQKHSAPSAISISGNGPTLAFLHKMKEGKNTADILLWNAPLPVSNGSKTIHDSYKGSSLFIPRILAYFASFSGSLLTIEKLRSIKKIFSGPEYLVWQLTGVAHTILPDPRFQAAYWTEKELASYEIAAHLLPPFVLLGEQSGNLKEVFKALFIQATELKINLDIPVFCAGPDFTSALIGTNTLQPGRICDRAGSSEGFNLCTEWLLTSEHTEQNAPIHTQIRNLPSVISPFYNASTLIPDSGIRFSKIKRNSAFSSKSYEEYVHFLLENPEEPGYNTMIELAHECKIAFDVLYEAYAKELRNKGITKNLDREITVTGGQAKNEAWLQLKARSMNVHIYVPSCLDAELTGNAAIAFWKLGLFENLQAAVDALFSVKTIINP